MVFLHCIFTGTLHEAGVSAWNELALYSTFNGGLCQRDNILESHCLNYVSGGNKKG